MSTSTAISSAPKRQIKTGKVTLWAVLFCMALSVLILSEIPLLSPKNPAHAHLYRERFLLIPHALAGTLAMLSGPVQFSTRLRQRNLGFHRWLGRVYVYSVLVSAPLAVIISWGSAFIVGTITQAGAWVITTLIALLTARNRHVQVHRQWMVRSYAVTFTFVTLRVLNPWPAYFNLSDAAGRWSSFW